MGILDRLSPTAQFIEVIEWLDDSTDTMVYRFPVRDQEIKNGAQLIVRESQAAVFVHEGQIADVFGPGRFTVEGGNTPGTVEGMLYRQFLFDANEGNQGGEPVPVAGQAADLSGDER